MVGSVLELLVCVLSFCEFWSFRDCLDFCDVQIFLIFGTVGILGIFGSRSS